MTEGEFEIGGPAWVQGMRAYAWKADGRGLYAIKNERGRMSVLDVASTVSVEAIEALSDYSEFAQPSVDASGRLACWPRRVRSRARVISWAPASPCASRRGLRRSGSPTAKLSKMQPVSWTAQSDGRDVEIFGNYYAPTNPDFESDGKPPALVMVHGGPTSQRTSRFEAGNQFFASRGFAVLDVNYRGSTGYGREYRDALLGQWGRYDVEDAVSAASFWPTRGGRTPIASLSWAAAPGGYTVLADVVHSPGCLRGGHL